MNHMEAGPGWGSVPLAIGLFVSLSAVVALCAKSSRRKAKANVPKSPLASPRRLIATISSKAGGISFMKKKGEGNDGEEDEGFGEGGLWRNTILMGEKCQPLEFPDAIFYDSYGNRVSEMPKSPRASLMSTFSFPVVRESMA
uniref:Uncharacterized protein n=1 Tax=Kalanchoe fedtschenkoi TaxID=63787 RepID=A0A7N0UE17_KALFE